ncbi:MAG: HD domain-containing protein [Pirellulaceae bacterium]
MASDQCDNAIEMASQIIELFHQKGDTAYGGEEVSQTEHAFQAATAAERDGADCELIVAALLHDVGHLVHDLPEDCVESGIDDHHQLLGEVFLKKHFSLRVTEAVRLHVAAKRYLCSCNPAYRERLSAASQTSLELQGGIMTDEEVAQFEAGEFAREATELRGWDDEAKIAGLETKGWEHFREPLMAALQLARDQSPGSGEISEKQE